MNRKIYLSGPISGMPGNNIAEFDALALELDKLDYKNVIIPHALFEGMDTQGYKHQDYMKKCIKALLDCDLVLTLDGWEKSIGAALEVHIARVLQIEIQPGFKFIVEAGTKPRTVVDPVSYNENQECR